MILSEQFDFSIFDGNTISINEKEHLNADFLIMEILNHYKNTQIISFYNTRDYYKRMTENVYSFLENQDIIQIDEQIIDDYYSAKTNNFEPKGKTTFLFFRSNSFTNRDIYVADFIIDISPLKSGVCKNIDGIIKIYNRQKTIFESKFKVNGHNTNYFQ